MSLLSVCKDSESSQESLRRKKHPLYRRSRSPEIIKNPRNSKKIHFVTDKNDPRYYKQFSMNPSQFKELYETGEYVPVKRSLQRDSESSDEEDNFICNYVLMMNKVIRKIKNEIE